MRRLKLSILPAALSLLALVPAVPAQACGRSCDGVASRDCDWSDACGFRNFESEIGRSFVSTVRWHQPVQRTFARTVTRFDVEAVRLFQRMP